jgi:hypothetical protein
VPEDDGEGVPTAGAADAFAQVLPKGAEGFAAVFARRLDHARPKVE